MFVPFELDSKTAYRALEPERIGRTKEVRHTEKESVKVIRKLFEDGYKLRHGVFIKDSRTI